VVTGWIWKLVNIYKLVKSDKSETGWNLISKVSEICKLVKSATVGTMDLGKNPAEPTGECGLRIVRCNWVKSGNWWNLQVGEIWQTWSWVKSESWWNLQVGEICNSGDDGLRAKLRPSPKGECGLSQNCQVKMGEIWKLMKSTSWWNLQAGETGNRGGWKRNLQIGEICKWVKQEKSVGENEIYKQVDSASGWNLQVGVKKSGWKRHIWKRKWVKLSNCTHFQQNLHKFTHIFVTSTNSPTTRPVFNHQRVFLLVQVHQARPFVFLFICCYKTRNIFVTGK